MMPRSYNEKLPPLPSDEEVLAAVADLLANDPRARQWATANLVAGALKIQGARRLGRGAMGGHSWSGTMSGALRISPRLRSLARRGLLHETYDNENYRYVYILSSEGQARLDA